MKTVALISAGLVAACGAPAGPRGEGGDASDDGWTRPPSVQQAQVRRGELVVAGLAEPNGRVVLRGEAGAAFATAADGQGRFRLVAPAPTTSVLLTPETQVGQESAMSPEQLAVLNGGKGPIAVLRPGASALRMDGVSGLGAMDGDDRQVLASGRSTTPVELTVRGRRITARPDRSGAWAAHLAIAPGEAVTVGAAAHVWPGAGKTAGIERIEGGWRIVWSGSPGTRQTTWLPDQ